MSRGSSYVVPVALLFLVACTPYGPNRPVRPAPPGPVDAIKSLWGDYSARCPNGFGFCKASGDADSLCCPNGQRCCEDANGPYCCGASHADRGRYDAYEDQRSATRSPCWSNEIACSHQGRTICCGSGDSCCVGSSGPYCCAAEGSYGSDRSSPY